MVYDRPEVIALQSGLDDRAGVGDAGGRSIATKTMHCLMSPISTLEWIFQSKLTC
jgi:hypothetical protein